MIDRSGETVFFPSQENFTFSLVSWKVQDSRQCFCLSLSGIGSSASLAEASSVFLGLSLVVKS